MLLVFRFIFKHKASFNIHLKVKVLPRAVSPQDKKAVTAWDAVCDVLVREHEDTGKLLQGPCSETCQTPFEVDVSSPPKLSRLLQTRNDRWESFPLTQGHIDGLWLFVNKEDFLPFSG